MITFLLASLIHEGSHYKCEDVESFEETEAGY